MNRGGGSTYLPHKPVVRQAVESTKVRVVYDASAKPKNYAPSLNDCSETVPPLQNLIWDVLARNRERPISLAGNWGQTFLPFYKLGSRQRQREDRDIPFHASPFWLKSITVFIRSYN